MRVAAARVTAQEYVERAVAALREVRCGDQAQGHQHSNRRRQCQVERRGEMPNVEEVVQTLRNFRMRRGTRAA